MLSTEAIIAISGGVGTALGVGVKSVADRMRKRDELDAARASDTIEKLWAQVKEQAVEIRSLRTDLDHCRDEHRKSQSETEKLAGRLEQALGRIDRLETPAKGAT